MDTYSKLEAQGDNVFVFPQGIPGFEHLKEFVFRCEPKLRPFFFMRSVEEPDMGFVCLGPEIVGADCASRVSLSDRGYLGLNSMDDAVVVCIVLIESELEKTTVNLSAPIILNVRNRDSKQVICEGTGLSIQHRVLGGLAGDKREGVASALLKLRLGE